MSDCVNIETKTCTFGYGGIDIVVFGQTIIFNGIKSCVGAGNRLWKEDGTKIGDWEFTGSRLYISFNTMEEIDTVCEYLRSIETSYGGLFTFKDITFDFTTYIQASMEVAKTAMNLVRRNMLSIIAC